MWKRRPAWRFSARILSWTCVALCSLSKGLRAGVAWRFYSVHAETRISVEQKTEQLRAVLADLAEHPQAQPAIVLGDFNTWQPNAAREVKQLFTHAGFMTPFPAEQATFYRNILIGVIEIKLDWVWLRGVRPLRFGIARKVEISDHWPLWADVRL
jgi:endonuclease/exonuclease/phosphatase family metal-dependent hydrolase